MRKLKIEGLTDVSETLRLPLYYRARESKEPEPLIWDSKAVKLLQGIDYDLLIHQWSYFDQPEARWRGMRLMRHIPMLNNSAHILHYRLVTI